MVRGVVVLVKGGAGDAGRGKGWVFVGVAGKGGREVDGDGSFWAEEG